MILEKLHGTSNYVEWVKLTRTVLCSLLQWDIITLADPANPTPAEPSAIQAFEVRCASLKSCSESMAL